MAVQKRGHRHTRTEKLHTVGWPREARLVAQGNLQKIKVARQRLVLCRLMIDIMRNLHGAYAPTTEPFGGRLETFFIGLCVALGEVEGRPFSITKNAAYMRVPRTTVMRRLDRLRRWGLIYRQGRHYYLEDKALNSLMACATINKSGDWGLREKYEAEKAAVRAFTAKVERERAERAESN